ncbi:MAG: transposase [Clostridia bacterium]|nr:transposase [Clostridia bacterium]
MDSKQPKRKRLRLPDYDYSTTGAYFITVCTKNHKGLFGAVGADSISARMVERVFLETVQEQAGVEAPICVVMPIHFHALVTISRADMESAPTISTLVQTFKRHTTVEYTKLVKNGEAPPFEGQLWQRSFYDHVIRNQEDFDDVYRYIEENPKRWQEDKFSCKD